MTTPLPMTGMHPGREDAGGEEVQRVLLVADDDRVAGVVAALVAHHVVDGATEQVGGLSLALVTPLSTEQHKCGHRRTPLPGGACPTCVAASPSPEPSNRCPGIDEAPGATATGALAPRGYLRKDQGVGSRPWHPGDRPQAPLLVVIDPAARRTDGESVRIAKDVLCAGAPERRSACRTSPEEVERALARRGSRRPVVVGDDRPCCGRSSCCTGERELADAALSVVPVGATRIALARQRLGVPADAVSAARAVLDGTERRLDLLVDDSGGVVLGGLRIPGGLRRTRRAAEPAAGSSRPPVAH